MNNHGNAVEVKAQTGVGFALARLDNIVASSDILVDGLRNTFKTVLVIKEAETSPIASEKAVCSDLAQVLMNLTDHLERNFAEIRRIIDSSDL